MLDACANNKNHLIELQEKINKFMQNVFDINGEDSKFQAKMKDEIEAIK